jgi:hypothetical protein
MKKLNKQDRLIDQITKIPDDLLQASYSLELLLGFKIQMEYNQHLYEKYQKEVDFKTDEINKFVRGFLRCGEYNLCITMVYPKTKKEEL